MRKYLFSGLLLLAQCSFSQNSFQKKLQTQLINVVDGASINIEAGSFLCTGTLSVEGKNNVTISGQGIDKTILSFKNQSQGAEGLRVSNAKNIIIENLTLQDSKGDLVKTMNVDGITFRNVKVEWTGTPKASNGAYGLYPVQCQNVLIDSCIAIGASDAGIYVGQSRNIELKNSKAYHNVAGIEIENSVNAKVHHCESYENTGGLLVFDLPDLLLKKGGNCEVFENYIHHNNYPNFAPKGNIVATVPNGTGILLLAANNVDIHHNQIIDNQTNSTAIISYYMTEKPINDKVYYPYPTAIKIHHNTYQRQATKAIAKGKIGLLYRLKLRFGKQVPHIIFDGIVDPANLNENGSFLPGKGICIFENKEQTFVNIDAGRGFKNVSKSLEKYTCVNP